MIKVTIHGFLPEMQFLPVLTALGSKVPLPFALIHNLVTSLANEMIRDKDSAGLHSIKSISLALDQLQVVHLMHPMDLI